MKTRHNTDYDQVLNKHGWYNQLTVNYDRQYYNTNHRLSHKTSGHIIHVSDREGSWEHHDMSRKSINSGPNTESLDQHLSRFRKGE